MVQPHMLSTDTEHIEREPRHHVARVIVSAELLREMLLFPEGTRIKRIRERDGGNCAGDEQDLELIVEHPDIQPQYTGSLIPLITPQYESVDRETQFKSWQ